MDPDTLRRARWERKAAGRYALKSGGAVLATVEEQPFFTSTLDQRWRWEAGHVGGYAGSRYAAQEAARKALQEAANA